MSQSLAKRRQTPEEIKTCLENALKTEQLVHAFVTWPKSYYETAFPMADIKRLKDVAVNLLHQCFVVQSSLLEEDACSTELKIASLKNFRQFLSSKNLEPEMLKKARSQSTKLLESILEAFLPVARSLLGGNGNANGRKHSQEDPFGIDDMDDLDMDVDQDDEFDYDHEKDAGDRAKWDFILEVLKFSAFAHGDDQEELFQNMMEFLELAKSQKHFDQVLSTVFQVLKTLLTKPGSGREALSRTLRLLISLPGMELMSLSKHKFDPKCASQLLDTLELVILSEKFLPEDGSSLVVFIR
jgi:hypothetical protein